MSSYKPFLIADFKTGLQLDLEPWRLPGDAFTEIDNAHIRNGVIRKRLGYTEFVQMEHWDAQDLTAYDETDVGANRLNVAVGIVSVTDLDNDETVYLSDDFGADFFDDDTDPWIFEFDFQCTDGGVDTGLWALTQDLGTIGSLIAGNKNFFALHTTAANKIKLYARHDTSVDSDETDSAITVDGTDYYVTVTVSHSEGTVTAGIYTDVNRTQEFDTLSVDMPDDTDLFRYCYWAQGYGTGGGGVTWDGEIRNCRIVTKPGYPIMGMFQHRYVSGASEFCVFDTKRMAVYNTSTDRLEDVTGTDTFTGDDDNFFSADTYTDYLFFVNGNDEMYYWNGASVALADVDIDGLGGNDLDTAKVVVYYKSRLLLLNTTEDGTNYPARVRFSSVGTANYDNDEYVDLPTSEAITGAAFLGDDLIISCERSHWVLKYTGDSTLPFVPKRISKFYGGVSNNTFVDLDNALMNFSGICIIATNGVNVERILHQAEELTLAADQETMKYCYGVRVEENDQAWIAYPESGESYTNKILSYNFIEKNVSTYTMAMHCFGVYSIQEDPTWDDLDITWDDYEATWDETYSPQGFPLIFGGDTTGWLYRMNYGVSNNGVAYDMVLDSAKMNPFYKEGRKARMGYFDILTDADDSVSITVEFYKDHDPDYFKTYTLTCTQADEEEKKWYRIPVNEVGSFFRVNITHSGNQELKIYALMPWFKPAGRII